MRITTMQLPDFLTRDEAGSIRLAGHRIDLAHVLHLCREGYAPETLSSEYPTVSLAVMHKVIAFYLENQAGVDAYLAEFAADLDLRRHQPSRGPSVAEMRERLAARHTAKGA